MTAVLPIAAAPPTDSESVGVWRRHLIALASVSAAMLLLFHRDLIDMAGIWWRSPTFNHCFLVPPIALWLVWQRLPELMRLTPAAWMPGLLLIAAGAMLWLLGEAGGVALARHLSLVLIFQGAVIATLGTSVARGIAFPLFYLLFAIPIGEELVPPMQTVTAGITMVLLHLADVPAHIEGIFITTPIGLFEVAEACSGVRFLIAMAAYAVLVANVCFRSWPRRLVFVAVAILIPVLANGVRAWGTIYAAERTGSLEHAVGFDHILYGWIFFATVMVLVMAAGWRFFDRKIGDPWFDPGAFRSVVTSPRRLMEAAAAAIAIAAAPPLWSAMLATAGSAQVPADVPLPDVEGWTKVPSDRGRAWRPHFAGADRLRIQRYRNAAGQEVDLAIAIFARQEEGRELVGYGQGAVGPEDTWAWTGEISSPPNGKAERIASHGESREVLSFYRVGTILTGSAGAVKLETMKVRLLGGPQRAVAILMSAPEPAKGVSPRPALDAFLSSLGAIAPLADRASAAPEPR